MKEYFKGIIPAMMTPVTPEDEIDAAGLERLAKFVSRDGINTVFALGYAGEVFSFTRAQRRKVIELTRKAIAPEKKIIAGVMGNSLEQILAYADDAFDAGADFVLTTPTNFTGLSDAEIIELYRRIADHSRLPVIVYNCPENIQKLTVETIVALSRHPNIVALKQTSDNIALQEVLYALEDNPDFTVLSGDEFAYLAALSLGVDCFIMGGPGNILPQTYLRIYRAYKEGRIEEAKALYVRMTKFLMELYALPANVVASLKGVLELAGLCGRHMKLPSLPPSEEVMQRIRGLIEKYDIAVD